MFAIKQYQCEECGETSIVYDDSGAPKCCGKPMKQLGISGCMSAPASAEHARPMDEEEPCDDNRKG